MQARTQINSLIEAPVAKGANVGSVLVELDGQPVTEVPLIALHEIAEGGIFRTAIDTVLMLFE